MGLPLSRRFSVFLLSPFSFAQGVWRPLRSCPGPQSPQPWPTARTPLYKGCNCWPRWATGGGAQGLACRVWVGWMVWVCARGECFFSVTIPIAHPRPQGIVPASRSPPLCPEGHICAPRCSLSWTHVWVAHTHGSHVVQPLGVWWGERKTLALCWVCRHFWGGLVGGARLVFWRSVSAPCPVHSTLARTCR